MVAIGQISTEKAVETVSAMASGWPIMVSVTFVMSALVVWFVWHICERNKKEQIRVMREVHEETIAILQKELYECRQLIKDIAESVLSMNR
jgi:hypothetical protein